MEKRRNSTYEQFEDAVTHILFNKPGESTISEDHEPTPEELEQKWWLDDKSLTQQDGQVNE